MKTKRDIKPTPVDPTVSKSLSRLPPSEADAVLAAGALLQRFGFELMPPVTKRCPEQTWKHPADGVPCHDWRSAVSEAARYGGVYPEETFGPRRADRGRSRQRATGAQERATGAQERATWNSCTGETLAALFKEQGAHAWSVAYLRVGGKEAIDSQLHGSGEPTDNRRGRHLRGIKDQPCTFNGSTYTLLREGRMWRVTIMTASDQAGS